MNHVTTLVEDGKSKLVVMCNDVEQIKMMAFLPALCRFKDVPFFFIEGKLKPDKLFYCKTAPRLPCAQP